MNRARPPWVSERTVWSELQELVRLLGHAAEVAPDWVELCELHQEAVTMMVHRACPTCLEGMFADDPFEPDPVIDDPYAVGEPSVALRAPRRTGLLYLPEKNGRVLRPGRVVVCETCADTRSVSAGDIWGTDDHPLVGLSWRAAWSICGPVWANDGGRIVELDSQTLAEAIASVRAAGDWSDEAVEIGNEHATVRVQLDIDPVGPWAPLESDPSPVDLLEELVPAFFHLRADGIDAAPLREPAGEWLQSADLAARQEEVVDILNQVADAAATDDLCILEDELAAEIRFLLRNTDEAVKCLRGLTSDLLTFTPEGFRSRWPWG